ncbi:DnaJ domain-containing protein [Lactarius hengduanensis]|nr:DnaJ domain-containing protein [Lactarius hengduanensis]
MSIPTFDFYRILGLSKDASFEDVRRAYKQKVLETHPDKLPPDSTEEEKEASHELFSKASEILGNPDRRREYDIHYRELPDPSVKSAFSPKSSTVSMSRSNSARHRHLQ